MAKEKITNKKQLSDSDEEELEQVKGAQANASKKQKLAADDGKKVNPKKKVQADSDDSDAEEIIYPTANKGKANQKADAKQQQKNKKVSKAESDSDTSFEEESFKAPAKNANKPVAKAQPQKATKKPSKPVSDDSDEEPAPPKKNVAAQKKAPAKKVVDEEESSEEEKPQPKKAVAQKAQPAKGKAKQEESSSEEELPAKKAPVKPVAKAQPKKASKAESSEEDSDEEEKTPVVKGKPAPKKAAFDEEEKPARTNNFETKGPVASEVFVGNLSFDVSDNDIKEYFSSCGAVSSVNLLTGPGGRSKGIAFVRFEDEEACNNAVQLNGEEYNGRALKIEKSTPKESRAPREGAPKGERDPNSSTIFVGNLSFNTTDDSVQRFFESCGKVKEVRIAYNRETQQSRGFAHVEFASPDSVDKAMAKVGQNLDGRPVRVDFSGNRAPREGGSFGGNQGGYGGGNRGGYGGDRGFGGGRGGFGGGNRYQADDTTNARKGNIGTFQGNKVKL